MKSNINKLILIEVIAGILFAFIASKILHMTAALQIMYLPFELIGKGLRFLSLSSAIGNVIAIIIYAVISMIPAIYIIYQRKRGRHRKKTYYLLHSQGYYFIPCICSSIQDSCIRKCQTFFQWTRIV